jgi:uncharacterized repeat protein (TIGR03806 family)
VSRLGVLAAGAMLVACGRSPVSARLDEPFPERLSEWKLFVGRAADLVPNAGVLPYDVSVPLFSDHAHKHRTVRMSEGQAAEYREAGAFEFPVGTVFSKTFYYSKGGAPDAVRSDGRERHLVETRLLVRGARGWVALPYVWDAAQSEATLQVAGAERSLVWEGHDGTVERFVYVVPNTDQCAGCHVRIEGRERRLRPLGPTARQLNRDYPYAGGPAPQLVRWQELGRLRGVPASVATWSFPGRSPQAARARAYLDVQCAHCHAPDGPAAASGLSLRFEDAEDGALGVCKRPVAAGRGSGGLDHDIVPGRPEASILFHRMASREPDVMMPELGRNLRDEEGLALVREWIASLSGSCS